MKLGIKTLDKVRPDTCCKCAETLTCIFVWGWQYYKAGTRGCFGLTQAMSPPCTITVLGPSLAMLTGQHSQVWPKISWVSKSAVHQFFVLHLVISQQPSHLNHMCSLNRHIDNFNILQNTTLPDQQRLQEPLWEVARTSEKKWVDSDLSFHYQMSLLLGYNYLIHF